MQLLELEDSSAAARRIDALRAKWPALAAWLEQGSESAVIFPSYLVGRVASACDQPDCTPRCTLADQEDRGTPGTA